MAQLMAQYSGFGVLVVVVAVGLSLWRGYLRRHPRPGSPPPGFEPTAERFRDPTTGILQVVWFNPRTGQRWYQPQTGPGGSSGRQR